MNVLIYVSSMSLLLPTFAQAENRIDCYSDANGFHTYLTYDGGTGQYKGRLYEPLKVLVNKNEDKISFNSPKLAWFKYYIDRSNGNKYSSYQLSADPNDFEWVKIAQCDLTAQANTDKNAG